MPLANRATWQTHMVPDTDGCGEAARVTQCVTMCSMLANERDYCSLADTGGALSSGVYA